MKEIWKDIKGYEGKYQISNLGRVRTIRIFSAKSKKYVYVNRIKSLTLKELDNQKKQIEKIQQAFKDKK